MNYHKNYVQRETSFPSIKTPSPVKNLPQGSSVGGPNGWFQQSAPFTSRTSTDGPKDGFIPTSATPSRIPKVQSMMGNVNRQIR